MRVFMSTVLLCLFLSSCSLETGPFTSPDENIKVEFGTTIDQVPFFRVLSEGKVVIDTSLLGVISDKGNFAEKIQIREISRPVEIQDSYQLNHGKRKHIHYEALQYTVHLENEEEKPMDIIFNLSNDGVAFRYFFPGDSDEEITILEEKSSYNLGDQTRAWLQPMSKAKTGWCETNPSYEENYLMDISPRTPSPIGEGWVYPALFKTPDAWVLISETGLHRNYCGTRLKYDETTNSMKVTFPQEEEIFPGGGLNPRSVLPFYSPWRLITIGSLATITESTLGTDLADKPSEDITRDFKSGLSSWSWVLLKDDFTNYETSKKFIDYASKMNWSYCLIDADWDQKIPVDSVKSLITYAKSKNVGILLWYNSSGDWNSTVYTPKSKLVTQKDRQKEFEKLKSWGVSGLKIDFFGGDGQSMIAYYHDILADALEYGFLINFHGATLPRGWHRTYPNLMTMESVKGEEFITFVQENADLAPAHCAVLPFSRNVFDPMDFTPMVLDSIPNIRKRTSPAFDLALPVLFLSGIQHIAEIPEGMEKMPDFVIQYLMDIPTNWDDSKFVDGFPGKYVIMARRKAETWHVVGINAEESPLTVEIDLSFIGSGSGVLITDATKGFFNTSGVSIIPGEKLKVSMESRGGFVLKVMTKAE